MRPAMQTMLRALQASGFSDRTTRAVERATDLVGEQADSITNDHTRALFLLIVAGDLVIEATEAGYGDDALLMLRALAADIKKFQDRRS